MSKIEEAKKKLTDSKKTNKAMNTVIDYVCSFINDDMFAEKVLNDKKNTESMWSYITSEAKKQAVGNSACISDEEVYNWAVHYFDEEHITYDTTTTYAEVATSEVKKSPAKKKEEKESIYMTLDLFGDDNDEDKNE